MFEQLRQIEARYQELSRLLADPAVIGQPAEYARYAKMHADLSAAVDKFDELKRVLERINEARYILADEPDRELRELARSELDDLEARQSVLEAELIGRASCRERVYDDV